MITWKQFILAWAGFCRYMYIYYYIYTNIYHQTPWLTNLRLKEVHKKSNQTINAKNEQYIWQKCRSNAKKNHETGVSTSNTAYLKWVYYYYFCILSDSMTDKSRLETKRIRDQIKQWKLNKGNMIQRNADQMLRRLHI